jgi:hypothetical protein
MNLDFTAVLRKVPEGYIGFVEELAGEDVIREPLRISAA